MTQSPKPQDKPRIGITIGDLNGIGPEVVIKAIMDPRMLSMLTPIVYGSSRVLSFYKKQLNIEEFNYSQVKNKGQFTPRQVNVVNCWEEVIEVHPGKPSKESGKASFMALKHACEELKEGLLDAIVTAPIDKNSIHSEAFPFKGHTEFLTQFYGQQQSLMFMVSDSMRVALVTEHISLREVPAAVTKERIESKFQLLENSLKKDFGITKPRIAVLALNPHAGDGGLMGSEDEQVIKPIIQDLKNKGKLVFGPFPADGFFGAYMQEKYDAVLAMYHDQGLIPFKSACFDKGVNFTAGLPIVRTSPDHGTGYSLAGKNQASEASMREAIYLACDIFKRRTEPSVEK